MTTGKSELGLSPKQSTGNEYFFFHSHLQYRHCSSLKILRRSTALICSLFDDDTLCISDVMEVVNSIPEFLY